jgi:transcriptional regulator with XRE-family HTH domain
MHPSKPKKTFNEAFAKSLIKRRTSLSMTQTELAKLSGISQGMISHIESRRHRPGLKSMESIAKVLNTKLGYMLR